VSFDDKNETNLTKAIEFIIKKSQRSGQTERRTGDASKILPKEINFPYSRHSSYPELCHLVSAFKPKDVWPCTVNIAGWLKDS
jgi:DNA cross-link repair 1C protein